MGRISQADYETVETSCEHCGHGCILNRREDFADVGPYFGRNVTCPSCRSVMWVSGDTVNEPFELFLFAARESFNRKRYMLAVVNMCQAWEIVFRMFVAARFLYRPYFYSRQRGRDLDRLNDLEAELENKKLKNRSFRKLAFADLRSVMIKVIVDNMSPRTLDEAREAIHGNLISTTCPSREAVSKVADTQTREILLGLLELNVGEIRNKVIHSRAYRPTRDEAERSLESARLLLSARDKFEVWSFAEFQFRGVVRYGAPMSA